MKVQLRRQAVRLRVDEEELAQLLAGESVENLTRFGGGVGRGADFALPALDGHWWRMASRWVMTSRCSFNSMWMYETACANEVRTVVHPLPSSGRATYVAPAMPRIGGETDLNPTKRGNQ